MFDRLNATVIAGIALLLAGVGLIALESYIIAAGLGLVLVGTALVAKGVVSSVMRSFGMF